jgi:acyl carrier protein
MLRDRIIKVCQKYFEMVNPQEFDRDYADFKMGVFDDWDSLGNLNLLLEMESEFSIRFSADELSSLQSLIAIEESIQAKLV